MYDDLNFSKSNIDNTYSLPSTSDDFFSTPSSSYCTLNTFSSPSEMSIAETTISSELPKSSSSVVRKGRKSRTKSSLQSRKIHLKSDSNESKLVSPKTCKLIQTVPNSAVSHLPQSPASKRVKNESSSNSSSYAICTGEKKISISPYITKRRYLKYTYFYINSTVFYNTNIHFQVVNQEKVWQQQNNDSAKF